MLSTRTRRRRLGDDAQLCPVSVCSACQKQRSKHTSERWLMGRCEKGAEVVAVHILYTPPPCRSDRAALALQDHPSITRQRKLHYLRLWCRALGVEHLGLDRLDPLYGSVVRIGGYSSRAVPDPDTPEVLRSKAIAFPIDASYAARSRVSDRDGTISHQSSAGLVVFVSWWCLGGLLVVFCSHTLPYQRRRKRRPQVETLRLPTWQCARQRSNQRLPR